MTEDQADAKLREYGLFFSKLLESARFRELMELYFTFTKAVNDETKEIDIQVIENPPEVVAKKMQGKHLAQEETIQVISGTQAQAVLEKAKRAVGGASGGRRYKDPKRR